MNFNTKLTEFQDRYHYPIDEDIHVNAPIVNKATGSAVMGALGGSALGAPIGGLIGSGIGHAMPGAGIGALVGGLGFGSYMYNKHNERYKEDIADPGAVYDKRRTEFQNTMLPKLQRRETAYINAIEDNAHTYETRRATAVASSGATAVHAYSAINKDDEGNVKVDPSKAIATLIASHAAYKDVQKAREQKAEHERFKNQTYQEREVSEQDIRTAYRSMHPDRRSLEATRVIVGGESSRLAKRAGLLSSVASKGALTGAVAGAATASDGNRVSGAITGAMGGAALGRTISTVKPLGTMTNVTGKMNSIKPFKPALLGTGG